MNEIEDFDFKPITKGLGFDVKVKSKTTEEDSLLRKSQELRKMLHEKRQNEASHKTPLSNSKPETNFSKTTNQITKPFQATTVKKQTLPVIEKKIFKTKEQENKRVEEVKVETASVISVIASFLIDMIFISVIVTSLLVCLYYLTFVTQKISLFDVVTINELIIVSTGLWLLFFTFYFTLFDNGSFKSLGKTMLRIKTVDLDNKKLSVSSNLQRNLIYLLNIPMLGILSFGDLINKMTKSQVIRDEH